MLQRAIFGALFVIILIGATLWNIYSFVGLFYLVAILGLKEFVKMGTNRELHVWTPGLYLLATVIYGVTTGWLLGEISNVYLIACVPLILLVMVVELFRQKSSPFENIAWTFLGIIWIVLPCILFVGVNTQFQPDYKKSYVAAWPILTFVLTWSNDTFAYLTGKMLGKNKLFPRISPNKTWEGTIGGVVLAAVAGSVFAHFSEIVDYTDGIFLGVLVGTMATIGDLVESMIKRSCNVKDSGNVIPGHGGILDRFDALFFTAPVVLVYLVVSRMIF